MSDISLSAGIRSSLVQLSNSSALFNQTTSRLSSGKKVATAIDNPTNFFAAVNLNDRAAGLSQRLDGMGQAVQRIKAADQGITTIRSFLSSMKGVVNNALGNLDSNARQALGRQFNELVNQIDTAAADSAYQGQNLLQSTGEDGETETVQFSETFGESTLDVKGFSVETGTYNSANGTVAEVDENNINGTSTISLAGYTTADIAGGLIISNQDDTTAVGIQVYNSGGQSAVSAGNTTSSSVNWGSSDYKALLGNVIQQIEAFDNELKVQASALANNLATITTREEFSNNLINTLQEGADALTLADLNEEGANLLALQTSNQLATQSLSLASQQSQSVLGLIG